MPPPPPPLHLQGAETTYDVQFLHNELFFAAAQKKYVYIYDKRGVEVHCLREHTDVRRLQFLPHHFMLASIGETGGDSVMTGDLGASCMCRTAAADDTLLCRPSAVQHCGSGQMQHVAAASVRPPSMYSTMYPR